MRSQTCYLLIKMKSSAYEGIVYSDGIVLPALSSTSSTWIKKIEHISIDLKIHEDYSTGACCKLKVLRVFKFRLLAYHGIQCGSS